MKNSASLIAHYLASLEELVAKPLPLSEQQKEQLQQLYPSDHIDSSVDGGKGSRGARESSLGWAGQALMGVAGRKWTEAKDAIQNSVLQIYY